MKGIILAGGSGTRLHPMTLAVSKQLLPVAARPMIYYPLTSLMSAGVRDILIITTVHDRESFQRLLGDGHELGISLSYRTQSAPRGIAEALLIGADHIQDQPCALILGDNIFHGPGLDESLREQALAVRGCTTFGRRVPDPHRFGIGTVDPSGNLVAVEEKPTNPQSNLALTGLYFFDTDAVGIARTLRPSPRGELEITDLVAHYVERKMARLVELADTIAWFDAGTIASLQEATGYVQDVESDAHAVIGCPEATACKMGYITPQQCHALGHAMATTVYGQRVSAFAERLEESSVLQR